MFEDTQPDEPKTLIEEKLKKATTERAPVAGQQPSGRAGRGGLGRGAGGRNFLEGLVDPSRQSGVMDQLLRGQSRHPFPAFGDPQTPGGADEPGAGASAAAGVLTAVDEDGEGDEEAKVPNEFEYFSDGNDDDDDDDDDDDE